MRRAGKVCRVVYTTDHSAGKEQHAAQRAGIRSESSKPHVNRHVSGGER